MLVKDLEKCCGCNACESICPKNCIQLKNDVSGFRYPVIDQSICINCHLCENVCPMHSEKTNPHSNSAFAIFNRDEDIRDKSSSGGVFSLLASYVVQNRGYVAGAAYTDDFSVKHIAVKHDINGLRGSKYIQSNTEFIYRQVKELLKTGNTVLFSGTPCQVVALQSYLQKQYNNLITVDVACHGVVSEIIWNKYLNYLQKKYRSKIQSINLRNKSTGWKGYSVCVNFQNGKKYTRLADDDPFMRLYRSNLCLRPSCYNCIFRGLNRVSDITLSDFWGVDRLLPEMDDDKGLSLVLTHSQNGEEMIQAIQDKIVCKSVPVDYAVSGNPAVSKKISIPDQYEAFVRDMNHMDFQKLTRKFCKRSITVYEVKVRTGRVVKGILSKIRGKK